MGGWQPSRSLELSLTILCLRELAPLPQSDCENAREEDANDLAKDGKPSQGIHSSSMRREWQPKREPTSVHTWRGMREIFTGPAPNRRWSKI